MQSRDGCRDRSKYKLKIFKLDNWANEEKENREKGNMKNEIQRFISWFCVPGPKINYLITEISRAQI